MGIRDVLFGAFGLFAIACTGYGAGVLGMWLGRKVGIDPGTVGFWASGLAAGGLALILAGIPPKAGR